MADPTIPAATVETQNPPAPAPAATPAPAADAKPATVGEKFTALKAAAAAKAAPPAAPAPATAKVDPDMAAVDRILAEDKRQKDAAKKIEAEKAATAADRTAWEAQKAAEKASLDRAKGVSDALAQKNVIGALKALGLSEEDIYEGDDSLFFKLAEAKTPRAAGTVTPEQISAAVDEKLAEKAAAEKAALDAKTKEAEDTARKAAEDAAAFADSAKEAYSKGVLAIAKENPGKYPALAKWNVPAGVITEYAWNALLESEGKLVISEEEALADVEAHYKQKSLEAAGVGVETKKPDPPPQHRGVSVNPGWQAQTGAPAKPVPPDMKGKFAALKERAREKFNAR